MSRSFGATSVTSWSPMTTAPSVTSSRPPMQRRSVVFPQPDGPTRTMNSPSSIVMSTPSTARTPFGNVFTTFRSAMPLICSPLQSGRDDSSRQLLLHRKEQKQHRDREQHRTCDRDRDERDRARGIRVAAGDLRYQRGLLVVQQQRGEDVVAPHRREHDA